MNIQLFDTKSNKPIANTKIQIQIKGKENGLLWVNTNFKGAFELEKKYADHYISVPSLESPAIQAKDGAVLRCEIDDKKSAKHDYSASYHQQDKHQNQYQPQKQSDKAQSHQYNDYKKEDSKHKDSNKYKDKQHEKTQSYKDDNNKWKKEDQKYKGNNDKYKDKVKYKDRETY